MNNSASCSINYAILTHHPLYLSKLLLKICNFSIKSTQKSENKSVIFTLEKEPLQERKETQEPLVSAISQNQCLLLLLLTLYDHLPLSQEAVGNTYTEHRTGRTTAFSWERRRYHLPLTHPFPSLADINYKSEGFLLISVTR